MTKSIVEFLRVVEMISYPGFTFKIGSRGGQGYLQVVCPEGVNNASGEPESWTSRKWLLSVHMTNSEVVQTAFKAVMTALEHEARELFTYKGEAVLNGHYDLDQVANYLKSQVLSVDHREEL